MVKINISRGRETINVCSYVMRTDKIFKKGEAEKVEDKIFGNMLGNSPGVLTQEFVLSQSLKPRVKVNCVHYSVSFPAGEDIEDERIYQMSWHLLQKMGHSPATQFFAVRHHDRPLAHFHLVASVVGLDGQVCKSSWDRLKVKKVEREIETEFALSEHPIDKSPRYLSHAEHRLKMITGKRPVKERLWEILDAAAVDRPTFPEFVHRLEAEGVEVRLKRDVNDAPIGISYGFEGMAYGGYHLGRRYTLPGLEKDLGVQPVVVVAAPIIDVPPLPLPEPEGKKRSRGFDR
jgi:hypothetical protein